MLKRLALVILLSGGFLASPAMLGPDAMAAAKKKGVLKKRSAYTAEQRQKILEAARKICRKKYGAPANVYRIDYAANRVWCTTN